MTIRPAPIVAVTAETVVVVAFVRTGFTTGEFVLDVLRGDVLMQFWRRRWWT